MNNNLSIQDYRHSNLRYLAQKTGLSKPEQFSSARIRMALAVQVVPDNEKWRLGLITRFMKMKAEKHLRVADSKHITHLAYSNILEHPF